MERWNGNLSKRIQLSTGHRLLPDSRVKQVALNDGKLIPYTNRSGGFQKVCKCYFYSTMIRHGEGLSIDDRVNGMNVSMIYRVTLFRKYRNLVL